MSLPRDEVPQTAASGKMSGDIEATYGAGLKKGIYTYMYIYVYIYIYTHTVTVHISLTPVKKTVESGDFKHDQTDAVMVSGWKKTHISCCESSNLDKSPSSS